MHNLENFPVNNSKRSLITHKNQIYIYIYIYIKTKVMHIKNLQKKENSFLSVRYFTVETNKSPL